MGECDSNVIHVLPMKRKPKDGSFVIFLIIIRVWRCLNDPQKVNRSDENVSQSSQNLAWKQISFERLAYDATMTIEHV